MDYLFQDGGKPKKVTKTKTKPKPKPKKTKGGNFLGSVGELVAPTGWESFVTTAGLFAIDRADAALRRGKESKKSVKKMSGGNPLNGNPLNLNSLSLTPSMQGLLRKEDGSIKPNNSIFLKQLENDIENEIRECELETQNFKAVLLTYEGEKKCPKTKRMILTELRDIYYDEEYHNKKIELTTNQYARNVENLFHNKTEKIDIADRLVKWYISKLDKLISRRNELLKKINQNNTILQGFLNKFTNKNKNETIQMKLQRELEFLEEHKKDYEKRGLELVIRNSNSNREKEDHNRKECFLKQFENGITEIKNKGYSQYMIDIPTNNQKVINELFEVYDPERKNTPNRLIEDYRKRLNEQILKRQKLLRNANEIQKTDNSKLSEFTNTNNGETIQDRLKREIKRLQSHESQFNNSIFLKKFENGIKEINTKKYATYMLDMSDHNTTKQRAINDLYEFYGLQKENKTPNKLIEDYRKKLDEQISKREELLKNANKIQQIDNSKISKFTNTNNGETIQDRLRREIKILQSHKNKFISRFNLS